MHHEEFRSLLGRLRKRSLRFSEFVDYLVEKPDEALRTSSTLIWEAIEHFGFRIVVRSGEPTLSYEIFKDPFSGGTNAVFGQEFCIKHVVDVIEAMGKESGPNRGIVLVGPPASGKTNIVDLISLALEEYTKEHHTSIFTFFFRFEGRNGRVVELRPQFLHNPVLLFPTSLQEDSSIRHPRHELFELINARRGKHEKIIVPAYFQHANLDKRSLDILESLLLHPRNIGKTLFDVIEEYVRVEEVEFSNAQAKGIANIDDMRELRITVHPVELGEDDRAVLAEHLPGTRLREYQGALVAANRGLLHIHDAFGGIGPDGPSERDYKPLLMLLGSGRASVEATQTAVDTTVILTTNLEEMAQLERQLTSSKLLDRIEKIPVNYLLDAQSEMEILRRDLANMRQKYDVDPNLLRVAAYFAVLTRLLPPQKPPADWDDDKKKLFCSITPEQKLFIYACRSEDPLATIRKLPHWHPFRSEMIKRSINIHDDEALGRLIAPDPGRVSLEQSGVFSAEELKLVDDAFMRALIQEHYPNEGRHGISVRQLQNIMRDTIANSDGLRVHVGTFFAQLRRIFDGGAELHHWLAIDPAYRKGRKPIPPRVVGFVNFGEGEADYGDFEGLARVAQAIYWDIIRREITVATVNRDPDEIARDLRRYLQHALLAKAHANRAFAHIMVPKYTYVDPQSGEKVDKPDEAFLESIEAILAPGRSGIAFRNEIAQRFLDLQASGELTLEPGKSVVASRRDNVLTAFAAEYERLLGHRRAAGEVDAPKLVEAFFKKKREPEAYAALDPRVTEFAENVLRNMSRRFGYSKQSALDTVLYAVRKGVVDFRDIIT